MLNKLRVKCITQIAADIMMNYDARQPAVLLAIVSLALKTFTTYPILLFCGREGIRSLTAEFVQLGERGEHIQRIIVPTVW